MSTPILADTAVSISDHRTNPMKTVEDGGGEAVAVLNRNEPVFYCVPAEAYHEMMEKLDDLELVMTVEARQGEESVAVTLDAL